MFQDNLKALRKKKGITQEEPAAGLNVVRCFPIFGQVLS